MSMLNSVLSKLENVLAAGSLAAAAALAILQVLIRTLFDQVLFWSEEAIIYLVISATFFGAVIALRHNEHVSVDILSTLLKKRGRRVLGYVAGLLALFYFGVIGWFAWVLMFEPSSRLTNTPALDLPLWVVMLPVPIGFTLLFLRTVEILGRMLRGRDPYPEAAETLLQAEGGAPLDKSQLEPDDPDGDRLETDQPDEDDKRNDR